METTAVGHVHRRTVRRRWIRWGFFVMLRYALFALLVLACQVAPVGAAPLMAEFSLGQYWYSFSEYWMDMLRQQNGIVMIVLITGAISVFIITRGKWKK